MRLSFLAHRSEPHPPRLSRSVSASIGTKTSISRPERRRSSITVGTRAVIALAGSLYLHLIFVVFSNTWGPWPPGIVNGENYFHQVTAQLLRAETVTDSRQTISQQSGNLIPNSRPENETQPLKDQGTGIQPLSNNHDGIPRNYYFKPNEVDQPAEPITLSPLIYPEVAYVSGLAARLRVRIFISANGLVDAVHVLTNSTKLSAFEDSAKFALLNSVFHPAILNEHPVNSQKIVDVEFNPKDEIQK